MNDARPRKRSLTLHGHRTSVSLEEAFWVAFVHMARETGCSVNALAARIDRERGSSAGLASAIRVAVLRHAGGDRLRAQTFEGEDDAQAAP